MRLTRIGISLLPALAALAPLRAQIAQAGTPLKAPPTSDSLAAITARGRLLAEYDFVAWHATDSVMARKPAPGVIQTYVAQRAGNDRWSIAFGRLNPARDTFFIAYMAYQRIADPNAFDVTPYAPGAIADTGYYLRAARALEIAARDFGPQKCPYNAEILERPQSGFYVYMIPAQTRPDVYPLGGDVRYQMSADGRTMLVKRRLHNAIIQFPPAIAHPGDALTTGMHTAVLDDIPEDTDVFHVLVRQPQVPEYIVSDAFIYGIAPNGAIKLFGRREAILGKDSARARPR